MGIEIPHDVIYEIISHLKLRSDLYNWCLVSRSGRDFATPRLYEEIWDAKSRQDSVEKRVARLRKFARLPESRLQKVKAIVIKPWQPERRQPRNLFVEVLDALDGCLSKLKHLETFKWECTHPPLPTTFAPLLDLESLTSLSINYPKKQQGFGWAANKVIEAQIPQFKNLNSFEIHGLWIPNLASAKRIARILINSPRLTTLGISLDTGRCAVWENGGSSEVDWEGDDDEGEDETEEHDLDVTDYFPAICIEFSHPTQDPSTGELLMGADQQTKISTPRLYLKNLELGDICLLTEDVHLLTDTSCLEHLSIGNRPHFMFGKRDAYLGTDSPSALSSIASLAPNLHSVQFDSFYMAARGLHISTDFPSLDSLFVNEGYSDLIEEVVKFGGGEENAARWKRIALGQTLNCHSPNLKNNELELLFDRWISKCTELTHLRMYIMGRDLPLLHSSIGNLSHLTEIHLKVCVHDTPLNARLLDEIKAEKFFACQPSLRIVNVVTVPRDESPQVCWRRHGDILEKMTNEEVDLLDQDGFPGRALDY